MVGLIPMTVSFQSAVEFVSCAVIADDRLGERRLCVQFLLECLELFCLATVAEKQFRTGSTNSSGTLAHERRRPYRRGPY